MASETACSSKGVALVTGSRRGIGRSIARRLASDGYDIALNDLAGSKQDLDATEQQIRTENPGRRVCIVVADVSVEEQVKNMVNGVVEALGRLDVMVANAGVLKTSSIAETTVEDLDVVLAVNVRGTFLCYKYAAEKMIEQGIKGRIMARALSLARGVSTTKRECGHPFLGAYCAAKFAIRGLTQTAAMEYGRHGITVNAYAPGPIETDMLQVLTEDLAKFMGEKALAETRKTAAVDYLGTPNDVAGLVSYLASPESHYLTGQAISIDGGRYFN